MYTLLQFDALNDLPSTQASRIASAGFDPYPRWASSAKWIIMTAFFLTMPISIRMATMAQGQVLVEQAQRQQRDADREQLARLRSNWLDCECWNTTGDDGRRQLQFAPDPLNARDARGGDEAGNDTER